MDLSTSWTPKVGKIIAQNHQKKRPKGCYSSFWGSGCCLSGHVWTSKSDVGLVALAVGFRV